MVCWGMCWQRSAFRFGATGSLAANVEPRSHSIGEVEEIYPIEPDPTVESIDAQARALMASGREPRKHHLVPRFYLHNWSQDGKVRMTNLDTGRTFCPNPANAARRTDFYRLEEGTFAEGTPIYWEVFLSALEGRASRTISQLVSGTKRTTELEPAALTELAWFVAVQATRGVNFRVGLQWHRLQFLLMSTGEGDPDLVRNYLNRSRETPISDEQLGRALEELEQFKSNPSSVPMLNTMSIKQGADTAKELAELVIQRYLAVYTTPPKLVTCDEPVTALDKDMSAVDGEFGFANAPILVLPLSPTKVLAMFHPATDSFPNPAVPLSTLDTMDLNRCILGNAHEYGFENPQTLFTTKLKVPLLKSIGQRSVLGVKGEEELHALYMHRRWTNDPFAPTHPVEAWWR